MFASNEVAKDEKFAVANTFRASAGWCMRFMTRHGLSLRQRTKIAQKLPNKLEDKILAFQKYIIQKRRDIPFEMPQTGNMDETLIS